MLYTTTRCQVRKLEMAASAIDLAAAFGWCVTWWMSYERLPGRGWTLDDPDTWSNLTTLVGALLYFAYNVRIQVSPGDYWDPSSSGYYIFVVRPQLRSACGAPSRLSLHFYHVCRAPSSRRSMATSSTLSAPSSTSSMRCVMMAGEAWRHFYDEAARLFLRKLPMPSSLPTSHAIPTARFFFMPSAGRPGWEFMEIPPERTPAQVLGSNVAKNPLAALELASASSPVQEWAPTQRGYGTAAPRQLKVSLLAEGAGSTAGQDAPITPSSDAPRAI